MQQRVGAVIQRGVSVLLIYRSNEQGVYYVTPGGHVERGESVEQGLEREIQEELGVAIRIKSLLFAFSHQLLGQHMTFYLTELVNEAADPTWQETDPPGGQDIHRVEWVPLSEISKLPIKPDELKEKLAAL